jgi:putative ABC transport system permease protein
MILQLLRLNLQSWLARKFSITLTILSISLGFTLLLSIQLIQAGMKSSFTGTLSKTDLIVGARSGSTQLLLYSIFHIGNPTQNIEYSTFLKYQNHPSVSWVIPISLGDSHKGYRVVGTDSRFFKYYKYRNGRPLHFAQGTSDNDNYGVVLGSEVARSLGYALGDRIIISHGVSKISFQDHKENPFQITGILEPTYTPVDRSLYVTLTGMDKIHEISQEKHERHITAFLLGVKSKMQILNLQREISNEKNDPLQAVLPLIALSEIWTLVENLEMVFTILAFVVVFTSLLGLILNLLGILKERRREIAILRSVGMGSKSVYFLFISEGLFIAIVSMFISLIVVYGGLFLFQPIIESSFGIFIPLTLPGIKIYSYLGLGIICAGIFSLIPGFLSYKKSLQDGLNAN